MNLSIHRLLCLLAICGVTSLLTPRVGLGQDAASSSGKYSVKMNDEGVAILLDDELIAQYWKMHTAKPIIWPLIGAGGNEITRGYPMREASETERDDHVHHRSMWLTHGEVNGFDFWAEGKENCGTIVPAGPAAAAGGSEATLAAAHDWLGPDGKRVLSDRWELTFAGDGDRRWIDCVFHLIASDGDVHFGDTKEGSFGLRLAGTMKVDAKKGGKIVNAEGMEDGQAWGKPSTWVDYYGPVEGEVEGVAIMNHPESYGYPSRWHVRTYGLFAANPFGVSHFTGKKDESGGKTLPAGDTWTLVYRIYLHRGDTEEGKVAEAWEEYRKTPLDNE
ncbi:MAG: PmoA family protein [Pirellulaceae bacterium]